MRWGIARGMDVDEFAPRLSFFFNAHNDFFEEIAKYRAARRIWAREMRETFKAQEPALVAAALPHADRRRLADRAAAGEQRRARGDPGAGRGAGRDAKSCTPTRMDEALALPSEHAVTIALRTQQIIAEESGVANTIDPLGGSFFVEAQTDRIEQRGLRLLPAHRRLGRRDSRPSKRDSSRARSRTRPTATSARSTKARRKIVGVNAYQEKKPLTIPILEMDPQRLQAPGAAAGGTPPDARQRAASARRWTGCASPAQGTENTMPYLLDAVRAYATLGEIISVMKEVFGVYEESTVI